jgi:hypothetical protein
MKSLRKWFLGIAVVGMLCIALPASASALEILSFEGSTKAQNGELDLRAGGHPYEQTFSFQFPTEVVGESVTPKGNVKDVEIEMPAGFVGDPSAATTCNAFQLEITNLTTSTSACPDGAQVGTVEVSQATGGEQLTNISMPLWNMGVGPGAPSEFGYVPLAYFLHSKAFVRTGGDHGITLVMQDLPQTTALVGATVTLWGVPSEASHDIDRNKICFRFVGSTPLCFSPTEEAPTQWPRHPFVTNPSDCTVGSQVTKIRADSWQEPGVYGHGEFSFPPPQECSRLSFAPSVGWSPDSSKAGSASGYSFDLNVPLNNNPDGLAVPPVKKVVATLPAGTTISPAGANGLEACSAAQAAIEVSAPPTCPSGSAIGTASIETPLLPKPLNGTIYVATPHDNPFGSLYGIYLLFEGFNTYIKLPGKVDVDPQAGQVTTTFDQNPQLPFSNLHLHFAGGPHAILTNPRSCGTQTLTAQIDSWAGQSVTSKSSFDLDEGCGQKFSPGFQAGTANPVAGNASPFTVDVKRGEDEAPLRSLSVKLPPGELAKLAGTPYCSDATLASISPLEGTGVAQLANPSCPAASRIGTAVVGAGPGPSPLYVNGSVYLAGPYKGAPLSIAVVTPAVAGPYDLGTVVVRNALRIDPLTTEVEAVSDPLPQIIYGVPLGLREVRVELDKPDFTVNPTSCEPMSVGGVIGSLAGSSANVSTRYQVGDCASLGFKPTLALQMKGQTKRAGNPALTATLKAPAGQANIANTTVILPKTVFIDQRHISNPCTRVQFAANACPAKSVLGTAVAYSPLLEDPLEGPVYFRSNGGERQLPDLVADLNGQIHVELVGFIDSKKVGKETSLVRTRFASVPDAPVSKFVLRLKGGKRSLIQNSANLCKVQPKAEVRMTGQNGKTNDFEQKIAVPCGKKSQKAKKKH